MSVSVPAIVALSPALVCSNGICEWPGYVPSGKDASSMLSVMVMARLGFDLCSSDTVDGCKCCPSAMMV